VCVILLYSVQCKGVKRVRDIKDNSNILQQQLFAITTSKQKIFRLYLNNINFFYITRQQYYNKATVLTTLSVISLYCRVSCKHYISYIRITQRSRKRNRSRAYSRGHSFPTLKTTEEVFIKAAAVKNARLEREVL
jgi:hypothetical protein